MRHQGRVAHPRELAVGKVDPHGNDRDLKARREAENAPSEGQHRFSGGGRPFGEVEHGDARAERPRRLPQHVRAALGVVAPDEHHAQIPQVRSENGPIGDLSLAHRGTRHLAAHDDGVEVREMIGHEDHRPSRRGTEPLDLDAVQVAELAAGAVKTPGRRA